MNKKPLLIASVLFGLAAGTAAYGFGGPGSGGRGGDCPCMEGSQGMQQGMQGMRGAHGMHGGVLRDAYRVDDLTADQRKQLDALRDKQRQQAETRRADREALQQAFQKGADAATVRPLAEKEGKHVTEMIMQQVEMRAQVEKILTTAQRAQLKETASNPPQERGKRGGGR